MNTLFKKRYYFLLLILSSLVVVSSCKDKEEEEDKEKVIIISPSADAAAEAQMAFIEAESGTTIIFEEGTFNFTNTLSMDEKSNIIVKGAGKELTYLDFSGQTSGGEGVSITNGTNIRFENIAVRDSEGDAIKANGCNRISFVNVSTIWTGTPSSANGAYGLYPVLCTEVYIDGCYAYGASDAGIYVGQSDKVILKNSLAEGNVAGIEIENTTNADVFDNEATDNTGGILVFDLPGLTQYGNNVRVFNNNSYDNNRPNFAPTGNIVASVPTGTGFMLLSTNTVEVFENTFSENDFAGVLIASYLIIDDTPDDPNYGAFPFKVNIHDNTYTMTGTVNTSVQIPLIQDLIGLLASNSFDQPNILLDGLILSLNSVCIQEASTTSFVNLNAFSDQVNFDFITDDITPHDCMESSLAEVVFEPF